MREVAPVVVSGGKVPPALRPHFFDLAAKSLIPWRGKTLLEYAVEALLASSSATRPIAVVGPEEARAPLAPYGEDVRWLQCGETLMDNANIGLSFHGTDRTLLILSPDLPVVTGEAIDRFVSAIPPEVEIAAPVITRKEFLQRFPGAPNKFLATANGEVTMGSVFFITGRALKINIPLGQDAYRARKYLWRLAYMAGLKITWQMLTRRLRLEDVEARASRLCDAQVRAVFVDAPELAYDIDCPENLDYLERLGAQE